MVEPLDYLHLQLRLEGKGIVDECFLRQAEVIPDEELPLLLLAQLADGSRVAYYAESMAPDLHRELAAHSPDTRFQDVDVLLHILRVHAIECEMGHYKTYVFPSMPSETREARCLSNNDPIIFLPLLYLP